MQLPCPGRIANSGLAGFSDTMGEVRAACGMWGRGVSGVWEGRVGVRLCGGDVFRGYKDHRKS